MGYPRHPIPQILLEGRLQGQCTRFSILPGWKLLISWCSLSITSSMSPNASASGGTPMNNLIESIKRAARTASYVNESHSWYSRLRPVEPNDGNGTTHGPQEVATRLTPISASLQGLSPQCDDTKTGSSVTYPAQITQSTGMLVDETPEDDGVCLDVPIPPFVMF